MSVTNASTPSITPSRRKSPRSEIRIGAVSYLNSKPLIETLEQSSAGRLILDYPSRLAESLARGELDVALIPSIEIVRSEGSYEIVSDACVAAHGPVRSVKVYFRVPPGSVKTLALDEGSRTSAALAQVLLMHKYGVVSETTPLPLGNPIEQSKADAILLIGDRAMYPVGEEFETVWDLGEQWQEWTGLPFVFAAWAARKGISDRVAFALSQARDRGVENVAAIAARESRLLDLKQNIVHEYLTQNLHFTLGPAEKSALKLFALLAAESGLAPKGNDLVFHERAGGEAIDSRWDEQSESRAKESREQRNLVATR